MSSYIIAGSADSSDTAYCEQIARRIKGKYRNIDFRIVIKHPSEWEQYLQQICRIYGFLRKSNPIIYTFDGKIIGNKEAFMSATAKYFGLDEESLNVQNLTNQVNMKIATQQINRKNVQKNNIQTISQKIQSKYQELLKKKILKHQLKQKKQYLVNGIQYVHRSVKGVVPNVAFNKHKEVKVEIEEVIAADIDLTALSLNDQVKIQEQISPNAVITAGKQAFVTANQKNNSEHDKMSEASRTNKMHESIISYDKDSKQMKESSKSKLRIDEEYDDVPDFIDFPMNQMLIASLGDDFHVSYIKDTLVSGEMIFYHNEDQNGNSLRIQNDNRPVKGHRVLIKEIHFDGQNVFLDQNPSQILKNQDIEGKQQINIEGQTNVMPPQNQSQKTLRQDKSQEIQEQTSKNLLKPSQQTQKIRTEPNLPNTHQIMNKNINQEDDDLSQINSDLNLLSHLNYHTLFALKPLSPAQLKNITYFINQTDCIGCLQFLGQNPNPKVKIYHRKLILECKTDDRQKLMLPVEKFIQKQLQDEEFTRLTVPNQKCYDYETIKQEHKFQILQINDIGFEHYLHLINEDTSAQNLAKVIKHTIDSMFTLQEQMKKQIGYNLILTKKFIMIVPLTEPYDTYHSTKLYFDGLAYLGFIQTANVSKPYQITSSKSSQMGLKLAQLIHKCANSHYLV